MAMEIAQVRHQPVAGEGRGGIDHQLVGLAVLVEATDPRGQLLEQGLGGAEQIEASVGQAHLASVAKEQRLLEIAFQAADLLADRRLGEVQLLGGLVEAAEAGGGFEATKGIQWGPVFEHC